MLRCKHSAVLAETLDSMKHQQVLAHAWVSYAIRSRSTKHFLDLLVVHLYSVPAHATGVRIVVLVVEINRRWW